jgi:hypothetical protein
MLHRLPNASFSFITNNYTALDELADWVDIFYILGDVRLARLETTIRLEGLTGRICIDADADRIYYGRVL